MTRSAASSSYEPEDHKDDSLFLVYLDEDLATFEDTLSLIQRWYPKLVDGGFMMGRNYEVTEVAEAIYYSFSAEVNITDDIWMAQKNAT